MEQTISMPRGLTELVEFKRLSLKVGGRHHAVAAVWHLWSHLANSVKPGSVGFMPVRDVDLLQAELADKAEWLALQESGWVAKTADGGWLCELFARLNQHLDPARRSMAQNGGVMKRFHQRIKRVGESGLAQMALLPAECFRVDGRALNSEEIRSVQMIVTAMDGVTNRASRQAHEGDWPLDLVANAHRVVVTFGEDMALKVCGELVRLGFDAGSGCANPAIPSTSELCLARFRELVQLVKTHPESKL